MANTIPCPNPVCTHSFSLAALQSAAQLSCPKCGFKMQGQAPAPPKPAPKPAAKPAVKPAPASAAVAPKVAVATPVQTKAASPVAAATPVVAGPPPTDSEASIADGSFFNPDTGVAGPLVRTKPAAAKEFNWMRMLIVCFSVGFVVCLVIAAMGLIVLYVPGLQNFRDIFAKNEDGDTYVGNIKNSKDEKETVYKLVLPRSEWAYDGELAGRFGGPAARDNLVTAWKDTTGYDFWFVVVVKDHGMYRPRDTEMLRLAVDKLEAQFGVDLEMDATEPAKFGALSARKVKFRGFRLDVKWEGECYLLFNNGIAYYLFLAAPTRDIVESFAEQLAQKNLFVVSARQGWREQPWPAETHLSSDGKVEVTPPKGIWIKPTDRRTDPKSLDANGKLVLVGNYKRAKDKNKNTISLIFTLEKKADLKEALKAARAHLDAREKDLINDKAKLVHAAEMAPGQSEDGSAEDFGDKRGRIVDLKLMIGDEKEPHRYYLLGVINEPDACYAIVSECSWASRQIWRQDFLDVLGTLRVK